MEEKAKRAALIAVARDHTAERSLTELEELAHGAGYLVIFTMVQSRNTPDHATYFGLGKLEELKQLCETENIGTIFSDDELSPAQLRGLEKFFNSDVHAAWPEIYVADRTMLILDIFGQRARSREGKLQVELAQLKYSLPRLTGQWFGLSRQGARGRGETKFETDRRHVKTRIEKLEQDLRTLARQRDVLRARRRKNRILVVAILGYTNVGKSTLMNLLTRAGVLAEDQLFATLDPTARSLKLPDGRSVMLIDTVGLVSRLPHQLVEAFHSTLEEAKFSDLILNLCDAASPDVKMQLEVTLDLLRDLGCVSAGIPTLCVMNKCDIATKESLDLAPEGSISISAQTGEGVPTLLEAIVTALPSKRCEASFLIPYSQVSIVARLRTLGEVLNEDFRQEGIFVKSLLPPSIIQELEEFLQ